MMGETRRAEDDATAEGPGDFAAPGRSPRAVRTRAFYASLSTRATLLGRAVVALLFAFALSVPHSVKAAQWAWAGALLAWVVRLLLPPRPALRRTASSY